jgi:quinol monooxygenase YgiN
MAETDRGRLIDAHRDLVESGRASDGCIHLAITADSVDPRRVNNVEVWTDSDALEAWRARQRPPTLASLSRTKRWPATRLLTVDHCSLT